MYADDFGEKLASAIGVQVVLSKPDGITKLGQHLKAHLGLVHKPAKAPQNAAKDPPAEPI
jgi:hypothetical protein